MAQIFKNLFSNSIKYRDSEKNGLIVKVKIFQKNIESVVVELEDNGIGIAKDHLKKIFKANYQITKSYDSGSGIGLYLIQKNIELLQAKIR